jgi:hypothetical protein
MTDAPERIWQEQPKERGFYEARQVKYIRADIAEARERAAVAAAYGAAGTYINELSQALTARGEHDAASLLANVAEGVRALAAIRQEKLT